MAMGRDIIHVDMDAFYASIEQRDNPELADKPVIVGAAPDARGVVSAASYEAREYGVHSAMPSGEAKRRCPDAVFLPVRMECYQQVSARVMDILNRYTPVIESVSIDEAFLDVTGSGKLFGTPPEIGQDIQDTIKEELQLGASVGIAPNKFLAKIASDLEKPLGLVVVEGGSEQEFLAPMPISRLWGVGEATEARLRELGIETIGKLAEFPRNLVVRQFGSNGAKLHDLAHGIDERSVVTESETKSISAENTYASDTRDKQKMKTTLMKLSQKVGRRVRDADLKARTINLKLRYGSFKTITRSRTLPQPTDADDVIYQTALDLLESVKLRRRAVRLIGVGVSKFDTVSQPSLFGDGSNTHSPLDDTVDDIRKRFGDGKITRGRLINNDDDNNGGL